MFQDDYARKWKEYQREFRQLEVDKTKDAYLDAEAKLLSQAEYAETMYALDEAERTLDDKYKKVKNLKHRLLKKKQIVLDILVNTNEGNLCMTRLNTFMKRPLLTMENITIPNN